MIDPRRIEQASRRFKAFFDELGHAFLERDEVLEQVALALLCREHALLTGPPGTAKSQLASAVFGRIVCADSGSPSVYARQITEATVQTDLIGPIDFKNLMETGRTSHFTDEGMLGATHAFLDEVFDGRDMLLRSALNLLQERELKEGTKITRGRIEVALMTSNRYIADVLEQARETLLAFVDRIAFIGFVPRSFADPDNMQRVLERHVAKSGGARLDALLTLQDLDVLQDLVERVVVSEPICALLAQLVSSLDAEINSAVRADPSFVPTRYLSTRTVVRSGKVLRAACLYDRIFRQPERELQVLPGDLSHLRLHLLLGGPTPEAVEALLDHETEPRERRQLETVRTEREIFDRCLAALPTLEVAPLSRPVDDAPAVVDPPTAELAAAPWRRQVDEALAHGGVDTLTEAIAALTAELARDAESQGAQTALEQCLGALQRQVLRAALGASSAATLPLSRAIDQLLDLASSVGRGDTRTLDPLARWLRSRALAMVDEAARHTPGARSATLALGASDEVGKRASTLASERLDALETLAELRARATAGASPPAASDEAWTDALEATEDDLAALWDAAFCRAVEQQLGDRQQAPLSEVLAAVEPELRWLDEVTIRLEGVAGRSSAFKAKAIRARLDDLIEALMARIDVVERATLHEEIERVLRLLDSAKLEGTVSAAQWLSWSADAISRSAKEVPHTKPKKHDHAGYRDLRRSEQRVPAGYTLAEVALRVAPERRQTARMQTVPEVEAGGPELQGLLSQLSPEQRKRAGRIDLDRIARAVTFLEGWWREITSGAMPVSERLEALIKSRFFEVVWDEEALSRFALEAQLVAELLPQHRVEALALDQRLANLDRETRRAAQALLRNRTDEAWAAALSHEGRTGG